ncbi:hypothetical protein [Thermoflavifilum thermophilum]|uniref:Outer membrane protein beta-barrel domain-containing protein n=1 Tax=Thermoflavifilum thermophilum TaxID=1393122 RepID=A0A1I7NC93_9BACT|nr:hypothetical protein [Thermoflavifilum thermophilum]SFV32173.1 hypothetical protein SAMN05660895_1262 [Thermoflavifilum thermophilum]
MNSEEEFHEEEWLRRLRQVAREFELTPAEGSWQAIERRLRRRRNRRRWAIAATWLLVLGAGGATWWMLHRTPERVQPWVQQQGVSARNLPATGEQSSLSATTSAKKQSWPPGRTQPNSALRNQQASGQFFTAAWKQVKSGGNSQTDSVSVEKNQNSTQIRIPLESLPAFSLSEPREQLHNPHPILQLPPGWGFSVSPKDTSQHPRAIAFRIAFAPGIGYRQLVQQPAATPSPALSLMRRSVSNYIPSTALGHDPAFSYTAGVEVQTTLHKRIVLGSGVQLLAFQYHIQAVNLSGAAYARNSSPMNVPGGGPAQLSTVYGAYNPNALLSPDQYTTLVNQQVNIELPVFAGYRGKLFGKMQWQVNGGAGVDLALHQQQYLYVPAYQRYMADDNQLRKWNVSALLSGSLILPVGRGQIFMGPDLHYQLLNAYRHQPNLKENLYLVSWKIGVIP